MKEVQNTRPTQTGSGLFDRCSHTRFLSSPTSYITSDAQRSPQQDRESDTEKVPIERIPRVSRFDKLTSQSGRTLAVIVCANAFAIDGSDFITEHACANYWRTPFFVSVLCCVARWLMCVSVCPDINKYILHDLLPCAFFCS